jgi:hypothetical protein
MTPGDQRPAEVFARRQPYLNPWKIPIFGKNYETKTPVQVERQ